MDRPSSAESPATSRPDKARVPVDSTTPASGTHSRARASRARGLHLAGRASKARSTQAWTSAGAGGMGLEQTTGVWEASENTTQEGGA